MNDFLQAGGVEENKVLLKIESLLGPHMPLFARILSGGLSVMECPSPGTTRTKVHVSSSVGFRIIEVINIRL